MSCRVRRPLVAIIKVQQASITLLARLTLNQPALLSEDRTAVLVLQPQAELAETSVQLTISNREMALVVHSAIVSKAYLLQVTLRLRAIAMGLGRGTPRRGSIMPTSPLPMPNMTIEGWAKNREWLKLCVECKGTSKCKCHWKRVGSQ